MQLTEMRLSDLREFERNVRRHSKRQIDEMVRSVQAFGQTRAIVCDETGQILVGNGLFRALQQMGWETAQCYVIEGLSDKEKKKLVLADNQVYNIGADDYSAIEAMVREITIDGDFDIAGFDEDSLNALVFDVGDIEEALDSYGTVTEQRLQSYEPPKPPSQAQQAQDGGQQAERPPLKTLDKGAEVRKSVVCPSCGEVIYLD